MLNHPRKRDFLTICINLPNLIVDITVSLKTFQTTKLGLYCLNAFPHYLDYNFSSSFLISTPSQPLLAPNLVCFIYVPDYVSVLVK